MYKTDSTTISTPTTSVVTSSTTTASASTVIAASAAVVVTSTAGTHSDGSRAAAVIPLDGDDLVVPLGAKVQTRGLPGVKVVRRSDGAARALRGADGPELLEGRGAVDGGLVNARADEDIVGAAIRRYAPAAGGTARRIVSAKVLDDVILYQRVPRPTVDGQVAVPIRVVAARVLDVPVGVVLEVGSFFGLFCGNAGLISTSRSPATTLYRRQSFCCSAS